VIAHVVALVGCARWQTDRQTNRRAHRDTALRDGQYKMGMTNHPIGPHPPETTTLDDILKFCNKFGHLILGKIIKFVATRCQISRLKCIKFDFCWGGALPQTQLGELTALPTPRSWINGALLLREKEGKGERGEGGRRECFTSAGWDKLPWSHVVRWGN